MMIRDLAELSRGDSGRIRFVAVHVGPERTGLPRADSGLIEFVPDPERECAGRLGVAALPTVVVLDRRRQEAVRFEGYSPALVEAVMQAVAVQGGG
ncbi:hypothetical protein FJY71_02135 [candidate division WOR-3 bacterium]|nr:hypothetical protein [candidate division WOR-3 bacterium]